MAFTLQALKCQRGILHFRIGCKEYGMPLRIKQILIERQLTIDVFAEALDMNQGQVSRFLSGARRTNTDFLQAAAKYLDLPISSLFGRPQLNVVGYIGAGSQVHAVDAYAKGAGMDTVDAPLDSLVGSVAVVVRGSSMFPSYHDGDMLIYSERREDVCEFIGRRVVCFLADERILIKTLTPGTERGLFTLISFNAEPVIDVAISAVAKIECIIPRE